MTTQTSTEAQLIDIGHTRVAYRKVGEGPDVVLIHGWPLHHGTWRNVVAGLDGYTSHLIDLPGAGDSKATADTPLTLPGTVSSIRAVIDLLGLERFSMVGHDSGGMFARMVAAELGNRVEALVLSGTEIPGHHSWQVALYSLMAKLLGSTGVLKALLSSDVLARSPLVLGGCFGDTSKISGEFAVMIADLLADPAVLADQLTLIRNFDNDVVDGLDEVHARLAMPTLLIWGEDDPFFPIDKAREMAGQFAGTTRFETILNAKLFVHEEFPERYAALARGFLDEVLAASDR